MKSPISGAKPGDLVGTNVRYLMKAADEADRSLARVKMLAQKAAGKSRPPSDVRGQIALVAMRAIIEAVELIKGAEDELHKL